MGVVEPENACSCLQEKSEQMLDVWLASYPSCLLRHITGVVYAATVYWLGFSPGAGQAKLFEAPMQTIEVFLLLLVCSSVCPDQCPVQVAK